MMSDISRYSIETHGSAHVLYQGRNSGMHGLNLLTLTEKAFNCDFDVLQNLLNKGLEHDKLTQQVAELRAALEAIKQHQEVMAGGDEMILSKLAVYAIASKALVEADGDGARFTDTKTEK